MKPIRERLEAWGDSGVLFRKSTENKEISNLIVALFVIDQKHREMLIQCFVYHSTPAAICNNLRIATYPATIFIDAFLEAEQALETALMEIEK